MRLGADALPFSRGLALSVAPISRSEIRRAPRQRGQTYHPADRRFRNRTVFQLCDLEYFSPDQRGGVRVLRAALLLQSPHSERFPATARRQTCLIRLSIEDNLPHAAWRKRRLQ